MSNAASGCIQRWCWGDNNSEKTSSLCRRRTGKKKRNQMTSCVGLISIHSYGQKEKAARSGTHFISLEIPFLFSFFLLFWILGACSVQHGAYDTIRYWCRSGQGVAGCLQTTPDRKEKTKQAKSTTHWFLSLSSFSFLG